MIALTAVETVTADILKLKNGNQLEGRVTQNERGDYVVVVDGDPGGSGSVITIPADQVAQRIVSKAPIDEFDERLERMEKGDLAGLVDLAAWAEFKGLARSSIRIYRRILRLDPHHEGARERLGYVVYRNRWVLKKDLKTSGLVEYGGVWRTPEEVVEARRGELEKELGTLFGDLDSDNRFIREGAFYSLLENKNPAAIPFLRQRARDASPLVRMVAGRVLGNHGYEVAFEGLYAPLLREARDEVATAWITILRSQSDVRLATRIARDLPASNGVSRRRLLQLAEACPHRDLVPALLALLDDPEWKAVVDGVLARVLGVESRSSAEWRGYWGRVSRTLPADLGSGWLKPRNPPRKKSRRA